VNSTRAAGLARRLKERKLAHWGIAYLSAAFVVFQAVEVLAEPWSIPHSVARATHTLLEHDPRLDQLTASPAFAGLRP
jgi:hypothetical protein